MRRYTLEFMGTRDGIIGVLGAVFMGVGMGSNSIPISIIGAAIFFSGLGIEEKEVKRK